MSDAHWLSIINTSGYIGLSLSTIGNFTLLMLLAGKSARGFGSYRYLMVTFSVFSLIYTAVEFFVRPLMHHYDNTIFVLQRKRFDFSDSTARILSAAYCGCFAMGFVIFAVHFIYRYYVSCQPEKLLYFRGRNYIFWILGMFGIAISWMAVAFFFFEENDETRRDLQFILSTCYGLTRDEVAYVPYAFFITVGSERKLRIDNFLGTVHHLIVMQSAITCVFYYGTLTYKNIIAVSGKSQRTRELQQQFFRALVVQTAFPLIFMFIPNMVLTVAAIVDGTFGGWANVTVVMTHLYPGVDPFVLIFLIKSFWSTITDIFCSRLLKNRKISVADVMVTVVENPVNRSCSTIVIS